MADIFLSYAEGDREAVMPLVQALEQQGWSVFWDRKIPLGKAWHEYIEENLNAARCVVVVWSERSVVSRWVREEAEDGRQRGILIPVFMNQVEAPLGFREVQGASLWDWNGTHDHPEFASLCRALEGLLGAPDSPLPPPEPESSGLGKPVAGRSSRLKWVALVLLLALASVGSWLGYRASRPQAEPVAPPPSEPAPEPDSLPVEVRYQQACNGGDRAACMSLGALYEEGREVGEDLLRAAMLYQLACNDGEAAACMSLGSLYEEGLGVAQDQSRAAKLYQRACDDGVEGACERVDRLSKRRRAKARPPTRATADAAGSTSEEQTPAQLKITVSPWGDVWLDGEFAQRAPWVGTLKPGKYTIGVGRGSPTEIRVIRLKPGDRKTEHFDLSN